MGTQNLVSFIGLLSFTGIAYFLSNRRQQIDHSIIWKGLALQLIFALLVLGLPAYSIPGPLRFVFDIANNFVVSLLSFTEEGSKFVFGNLVNSQKMGFILAFQVLPTILFMSSVMAVLYHWGVMQKVVNAIARVMQKTLKTSGAESLSAAANIFVGQTEAPLVIRPFVTKMTQSELFCIMVGGMATVAGGVMAAYVGLLKTYIPDIAGHLLTASVLSAPAALLVAKLMYPETEKPETLGTVPTEYSDKKIDSNTIEAAARGASEGLYLAFNVAAMLIAFIALVAILDAFLKWFGGLFSYELTASIIFGWFFSPIAWLMGIQWSECGVAGSLLGQKVVLNEFVAYLNLSQIMNTLSPRTVVILSYALCGFANFSSIGIQIGGIGSISPERRSDLAKLGVKAVIGGSLAAFMTAAVAGMFIP